MSQNNDTVRFAEAYATLKQCAQAIEAAPEDDLDTVIAHVEKARQAKLICEERIKAANQKLTELLGNRESAPF
jgi:exonuclease VII small subunit